MGGKKIGGKSGEVKWGVGYVNGRAARLVRKMPFHSRHSTHTTHVPPRLGRTGAWSERAPSVIPRPQCKNSEGKKNRKVGRSVGRMGPPPEVEVPRKV